MKEKTCSNPDCNKTYPETKEFFHWRNDRNMFNTRCVFCIRKKATEKYKEKKMNVLKVDKVINIDESNVIAVIQARENSTRFPNKVLEKIYGLTILELIYERARVAKVNKTVIATTKNSPNIINLCKRKNIPYFVGDENDVLDRYSKCVENFGLHSYIIRITADCPLIDPKMINMVLIKHIQGGYDYTTNAHLYKNCGFPEGLDVQVVNFNVLKQLDIEVKDKKNREHVTSYIMENPEKFKIGIVKNEIDYSHLRLSVDYPDDLEVVRRVYYEFFDKDYYFGYEHIIDLYKRNPEIFEKNMHYKTNEAYFENNSK